MHSWIWRCLAPNVPVHVLLQYVLWPFWNLYQILVFLYSLATKKHIRYTMRCDILSHRKWCQCIMTRLWLSKLQSCHWNLVTRTPQLFQCMRQTCSKSSCFLIIFLQNISKTIFNIPVYISVQELKRIMYFTLLPPFIKWLKEGFTLAFEDLQLHFKDWVELIPVGSNNEDVNMISSKFFLPKGKAKTVQFHPNKVLELYLELPYDKYIEVQNYLEDLVHPKFIS